MWATLSLQPASTSKLWHYGETSKPSFCGLHIHYNSCMRVWVNHHRSTGNAPGCSLKLRRTHLFQSATHSKHIPQVELLLLDMNVMGALFIPWHPPLYVLFLCGCHHRHWIKYGGWYEASHWQMRQILKKPLGYNSVISLPIFPEEDCIWRPASIGRSSILPLSHYISAYWSCKTTWAPWPHLTNRRCDIVLAN